MKLPTITWHIKEKKSVIWGIRIFTVASIAASLFTMPVWMAFTISALLTAANVALSKIKFSVPALHISPFPERLGASGKTAIAHGVEDYQGEQVPMIGFAYEIKEDAVGLYQLLKAWNYGSYDDTEGNITISYILEDVLRYTIFLYPNPERRAIEVSKERVQASLEDDEKAEMEHMFFFEFQCATWSGDGTVVEMISRLKSSDKILLRVLWMQSGSVEEVRKRPLVVHGIKVKWRHELTPQDLEFHTQWKGPNRE